MQSPDRSRALRGIRKRSLLASLPLGAALLIAVYGVSLTLSHLGVAPSTQHFTYDNDTWTQHRTGTHWAFSISDPGPKWDLSKNPTPSLTTRLTWQLDRKLVWNSTDPDKFVSGGALGILGPSLVRFLIFPNEGGGFTVLDAGGNLGLGFVVIPYRPTWILIADLALCMSIAGSAWFGAAYFRITRREKAGLCLTCGYPKSADICPECGNGTALA